MKLKYFSIVALMSGLVLSSCVKDDIYNGPATISNVAFSPGTVTPDDIVTVTAVVTALKGVHSVNLFYKADAGSYISVPMTAGTNNTYSGTISKQVDKTVITFYVSATTNGEQVSQTAEKTYSVGAIPPNYAAIILNEVDGNTKFVELYNNSDQPVNISGMAIIKNGTSLKNADGTPNWIVPTGTIIPGRGYGVIKCNGYTATADPAAVIIGTVGDGMSAKQTLLLELTKPDGTVLNTFQRGSSPWGVTISAIASTNSYSRCPDGTGAWKTALYTPGKANGAATGDIPSL
ncbi:MAG TPA: lamin tail domain-containing protein [Chitinophagaceae bacterium]|jgi:hypothetical protein|nr:lamin tail domain-containing protein [Chitinophagaceae bacterium]